MTERLGARRREDARPADRPSPVPAAPAATRPRRTAAAISLAILLVVGASAVAAWRYMGPEALVFAPRSETSDAGGTAGDRDAAGIGEVLATRPSSRTELGALRLDDPLEAATAALGPATRSAPDINAATTYVWELDGGVELGVTADDLGIVGLYAAVPPDAALEVRMHGDVLVGRSTPDDVIAAWGPEYDLPVEGDDFVLRYTDCLGPFPVMMKFDQDRPGGPHWDAPVTAVHLAYADAGPGTHGCITA